MRIWKSQKHMDPEPDQRHCRHHDKNCTNDKGKQAHQSLPGPKAPAGLPLYSYCCCCCCCCCWRDPPKRKTPCGHQTAKSAAGSDPPAKVAENCRSLSTRILGGLQQRCPAAAALVGGSVEPRPLRFWPPRSPGPRWPPAAGWSSLPALVDTPPAESKRKRKG